MRELFKLFSLITLLTCSVIVSAQHGKGLYFVFLNPNADAQVLDEVHVQKLMRGHLNNMDSLHKAGHLLAAGPFHEKGGIMVLLADSLMEAYTFIETDPAIQAQRFVPEVFPFVIEHGQLCEVDSAYTMEEYQFLRLSPFPLEMKEAIKPDQLEAEHMEYIQSMTDSVTLLLQGAFSNNMGKIMVFDSNDRKLVESAFQQDPYVKYMKYAYDIRTLWIARESFCK